MLWCDGSNQGLGGSELEKIKDPVRHTVFIMNVMRIVCPYLVAELLGIDGKELQESLTTSGMVARGETIVKNNRYTTGIKYSMVVISTHIFPN